MSQKTTSLFPQKKNRILRGSIFFGMIIMLVIPIINPFSNTSDLTPKIEASENTVNVWWPTNGSTIEGTQPFKAVLTNKGVNEYNMYWQVDGGNLNSMYDSYADYQHKEAIVNVSGWNWNSSGVYVITFVSKDFQGNEIARASVNLNIKSPNATPAPVVVVTPASPQPVTQPIVVVPVVPAPVVVKSQLYVDPKNPASAQAELWAQSRPFDAQIMKKIGNQSTAHWYGGWNSDITKDVSVYVNAAKNNNATPTLVAYNIPGRDCGSYSSGGLSSPNAYASWIQQFSSGLGQNKAIVILEPDALSNLDCLSPQAKSERYSMLQNAVSIIKSNNPNVSVYLDAGHPGWVKDSEMANRLISAGVQKANGFSLNVSNFVSTGENIQYGKSISKLTNNSHFVIDTSRNGVGANNEWCNPSGRALGQAPNLQTNDSLIDGFLWIKQPGESDGNCNGGPNAGVWWADYALNLAKTAGY